MNHYWKFGLMMATSFVIMYTVMYLNVDQFDHVYTAATRTYMTVLMIAPMAITMMLYMWKMYEDKRKNYIIMGVSLLLGVVTYAALREQTFVDDKAWIRAMIPHHSSAIMVSGEAHLTDPEAIELAEEIIESQKREIAQMEKILYRLQTQE